MTDLPPPSDPFANPPAVTEAAVPAAPKKPWPLIVGALAVVAAVIVGIVVFAGGDDDNKSTGSPSSAQGEWHLVRYVGDEVDAFEVLDANGAVVTSVPVEGDGFPALARSLGRWAVSSQSDSDTAFLFDLAEGSTATITLPEANLAPDRALMASGTSYAVYFDGSGGSLALVNMADASVRSIGSSERGYFPLGPRPGYSLYMSIEGLSTVIIPHDDPSQWWEVPGPVSSISGRETLVLGMVDDEPAVRHFDGDQQQGKTVQMKAPQYAALFSPAGATTVDTGGGIWSIDLSSGDYESIGTLGIGVDGAVPISADRMMTWGSSGSRVITVEGEVTQELDPVADGDGEMQPFMPLPGGIGSKCLTVQPGQKLFTSGANAITVDLATEEPLVRFEGTPTGFSVDGCTAISMAAAPEVMIDGAIVTIDADVVQTFSPDNTQVIGVVKGDSPQFFLIDVASGARTQLTAGAYFWARF